jgi:response regulator of citrate/malate metabolism
MGPRYNPIPRLRKDQYPRQTTPMDGLDEALRTTKAKSERAKELRDKGLTMDEIADALSVSRMTVHRYLNVMGQ